MAGVALFAICTAQRPSGSPRDDLVNGARVAERRVLVKFRAGVDASRAARIKQDLDADDDRPVGGAGVRILHSRSKHAADLLTALARHSEVEYAEPDYVVHPTTTFPNDPFFNSQWGLRNIGQTINGIAGTIGSDVSAAAAWDGSLGSGSTVIGIVDSALDYTHPDLAPNIWSAPAEFLVNVAGTSIVCPAGTHGFSSIAGVFSCDSMAPGVKDHATHVAGIAGAAGNNGQGVTGVGWRASLMGLTFMTDTGYTSDAINVIEFAILTKAWFAGTGGANVRVLNNSWGGDGFSQALQDEIDRAAAIDMLFVAAAGNNGSDLAVAPFFPASYGRANMLTVAASDANDRLSTFSNYGQSAVQLAAPGQNILSTLPQGGYGYMNGTSMAAPFVTGAAALVLSRCDLSTRDLRSLLLASVDRPAALAASTATGGRLNVARALQTCSGASANAAPSVTLTSPSDGTSYSAPARIALSASAADADGSVVRVDFYAGTLLVGSAFSPPYQAVWDNVPAGSYSLTALATDNLGAQTGSSPAAITVAAAPATSALPGSWRSQDIGDVGLAGSSSYSNGTFIVSGAGATGVWDVADTFQFAYQPLAGDGQIVARLTGLTNTDTFAKSGLMIRQSLDASAANVVFNVRPTLDLEFMTRPTAGAPTTFLATAIQPLPAWLKLTRAGATITGWVSGDGVNWTIVGTTSLALQGGAYIGLISTSVNAGALNTSTFDNVIVSNENSAVPVVGAANDVVIYASDVAAAALHGSWRLEPDASSPNGVKLATSDAGFAETDAPLAEPTDYMDISFTANAFTPYTLWLRMRAQDNSKFNDSVWVQFSDATAAGSSAYPIGSTRALLVNLANDASASSLAGWGWQNGAYWLPQSAMLTFPSTGVHTLRIQVREDGVQIDQIVLSPSRYFSASPGPLGGDRTFVSKPAGVPAAVVALADGARVSDRQTRRSRACADCQPGTLPSPWRVRTASG